jgi:hypothetical protein
MAGFWQHKPKTTFIYSQEEGLDLRVISGEQALSDWNREILAGEHTQLFINGDSIANIRRKEGKEGELQFGSTEELGEFFATHLFSKVVDLETRDILVNQALQLLHQGGLTFASHICLVSSVKEKAVDFPNPKIKVDFIPTADGVLIKEENTYSKMAIHRDIHETKKHFAQTKSIVLLSLEDGEPKIEVKDLTIDCPDRRAATLLDRRSLRELVQHFINKLLSYFQKAIPSASPAP